MHFLSRITNTQHIFNQKMNAFKTSCKSALKLHYIKSWEISRQLQNGGKLQTYITFKQNFGLENHLLLIPFEQRKNITKLRTSSHRLEIECGRYKSIPRQERICRKCVLNEVEDEVHFLFNCPFYHPKRELLHSKISTVCPKFTNLNDGNKLIWLMNVEDIPVLLAMSSLILQSL